MTTEMRTLTDDEVAINADMVPELRRLLTIGLHCFGEVDRVRDVVEQRLEFDMPLTREAVPVVVGTHEVANFADALLYLDSVK